MLIYIHNAWTLNIDWDWLTRGVAQDHSSEIIHPWIEIGQTQPSARYRHLDKGWGGRDRSANKIFSVLRTSVWSKNKRVGWPPWIRYWSPWIRLIGSQIIWYVQSTVNKAQFNGAKCSDFFSLVISIYNVSSLNYLGLAKRLQVAQRSLTPVFSCSSKARSVNSSRLEFVSFKFSPSGAMSLAK